MFIFCTIFINIISSPTSSSCVPTPNTIDSQEQCKSQHHNTPNPTGRVLVPLGGGKDSLTLMHLLLKQVKAENLSWFFLGETFDEFDSNWRYQATVKASPVHSLFVGGLRTSVPDLPCTDKKLTGTTPPWAACVGAASTLLALAEGFSHIVVGNERSADEDNGVIYMGQTLNHQHDKSLAYERAFQKYLHHYVSPTLLYWSGLKSMWEVQIAREFCKHLEYLPCFFSCNISNTSRWCSECSKCCFVFVLLSAWLPPEQVWRVFGDNLFERPDLFRIFRSLLGSSQFSQPPNDDLEKQAEHNKYLPSTSNDHSLAVSRSPQKDCLEALVAKPLDCVGTPLEVQASLYLAKQQYQKRSNGLGKGTELRMPEFLEMVEVDVDDDQVQALLNDHSGDNAYPAWYNVRE
eukprot:m.142879 g.142879  ORF g.142879 m.142879 type:complete len:404 (+) comp24199_c0_seq1:435-1646(+)